MSTAWRTVALKDICRLINGRAYKKSELLDSGPYPVLRVGNFFTNRGWYYSDLELAEDKYCDTGDLLYAWSASFGPRVWEGGKVIFHYHIWKVDLNESLVDKRFLYYWFEWDKERIKQEQGAGTTMIHVTKGAMEERILLLPSLSEQRIIIDTLDEAFEGIDTAIANAEKNLANTRELFESYLNKACFNEEGEWVATSFGEVAEFKNGLNYNKSSKGEVVPVVGVKDFVGNFKVPFGQLAKVRIDGELSTAYNLKKNDIIIVRSNGNRELIGRVLLFDECGEKVSFSGFTIRARLNDDGIDPAFITYQLKSRRVHEVLVRGGDGANISSLNQKVLSGLTVLLPSLNEQKEIVARVQKIETDSLNLETIYSYKIKSLNELKQSLLQKAFSGELTASAAASDTIAEEAGFA